MILREIKFNIFNIPLLIKILLLYIPFICVAYSKGLYVQAQSVTSFFAFFYMYLNIRQFGDNKSDFIAKYLLVLFIIGSLIGLFYSAFANNDFYKYIQYSFLAYSSYIAYSVGYKIGKFKKSLNFIFFIFFVDMIMFLPLLLNGSLSRTSIGTSNLFPLIFILLLNLNKFNNKNTKNIIIISFCLVCMAYLISGMRSSIGVMFLSIILIFIYFFKIRFIPKILKFSLFLVILMIVGFYVLPNPTKQILLKRLEIVEKRFSNTIFNEDGITLDEKKGEGRDIEALSAWKEFIKNVNTLDYIIGKGHGFVYYDDMQDRVKAHIHMSIMAFMTRYGIVGVFLYILLWFYCILNLFKIYFKNRSEENQLKFGLFLSMFQILLISLIAASLIYSIHLFIIGYALGFNRNRILTT